MGALGAPLTPSSTPDPTAPGPGGAAAGRRAHAGAVPVAERVTTTHHSRVAGVVLPAWAFACGAAALIASVVVVAWQPRLWPVAVFAAVGAFASVSAIGSRRAALGSRALGEDLMVALRQAEAVVSIGDLDGGWVADVDGDIEAIMGYTLEEWRQLDFHELIHPDDVDTYWIDRDTIQPGTVVDRTGRLRHADGRWIWIREVARVGVDPTGRRTIRGFFFDVSGTHEHARLLAEQARTDGLTGLPNRVALLERIDAAFAESGDFALLMLDLDRFKEVNDTLGHEAGDHVLTVVAARLAAVLEPGDRLFRLGGDEFAVVAPGCADCADLEPRLAAIAAEASRPIEAWGIQLVLAVSTGVALPRPGSDRATLMRHADLAMYAAKQAGEPWRLFDDTLDHSSTMRLSLTAALETALATGQFELYLQPQVDLATRRIVGAEGLARWRHPEFGLLAPGAFLDVVLMSELTAVFTTEMVRQAVDVARRSREWGRELPIAVNVSMRALGDVGFVGAVLGLLQAGQVDPRSLTIEITENDVAEPSVEVLTTLEQLAVNGVRISVDDFGTGYSSLARLQAICVHELKIDRTFVAHLADDPRDRHLAATIVELARGLGYRVVAEGVETEAQAAELTRIGCDTAQGYLFSGAVTADELAVLLTTRAPAPTGG